MLIPRVYRHVGSIVTVVFIQLEGDFQIQEEPLQVTGVPLWAANSGSQFPVSAVAADVDGFQAVILDYGEPALEPGIDIVIRSWSEEVRGISGQWIAASLLNLPFAPLD